MANSEDIIIPGVYSEQIEFSGRVTPTDGVYREGIPVQILQDGIVLAEVYTDSQGYYSGQCDDYNEDLNNNIIAKIGDDTAQWNYVNSINLTSNSNTASAGDTIALTATVLDSNNDPASDRTVTFFKEKCESFTGEGSNSTTTINVDVGESYDIDFSKITSGMVSMAFGNIGDERSNALYFIYDGGSGISIRQIANQIESETIFAGTSVTISNGQIICGNNQIEIKNGINYALLNKISADNGQTVDVYSHEIIGTATTNNSGVASVSYLVQGSETLYIKAKCIIFSKTCSIHDYPFITYEKSGSSLLSDINSKWINQDAVIADNNPYVRLSGSGKIEFPYELPNSVEIEYTIKYHTETDNSCEFRLYSDENPEPSYDVRLFFWRQYVGPRGVNGDNYGNLSVPAASEYTCKIVIQEDVLSFYVNNTLKASRDSQPIRTKRYLKFDTSSIIYLKSIKITRL